jgi:uncharacterized protein (TIGR02246 family)
VRREFCGIAVAIFAIVAFSGCGSDSPSRAADEAAIRQRLNNWPKAIAAGNAGAVCDLFARDALVIFPGQPNRGWREECDRLRSSIRSATHVRYDRPEIEEIVVDDDLAVVRLTWTARISSERGESVEVERGLDVFERGDDGVWRIRVSQAFPIED